MKNQYWEAITTEEFNRLSPINLELKYFQEFKKLVEPYRYQKLDIIRDADEKKGYAIVRVPYHIIFKLFNSSPILIYECQDEWFKVKYLNEYYKCDQWEGVLMFLKYKLYIKI